MAGKNILVVEDDQAVREAIVMALDSSEYQTHAVEHGQAALSCLESFQPDLVLLDLMMPVMDGWEFVTHFRRRVDHDKTPIVLVSADRNLDEKARTLGVAAYLNKPFDIMAMLDTIEEQLKAS